VSLFELGREPLMTTLPAAWPNPRTSCEPTSSEKPGTRRTISSALDGENWAK
jgi:hypothetical protein